ncbi:hypothetical protein BDQ12DRAFT_671246 [Crucibulum laeve]|uniref:Uncharacterized protein n=1 Tax=Crucibulum laeve TaxID=68775 RepID=A0A5C3LH95_9AGAR|nr:hypothetical protein BDQ12DRAFT_671246 [Crucibulum laeve]
MFHGLWNLLSHGLKPKKEPTDPAIPPLPATHSAGQLFPGYPMQGYQYPFVFNRPYSSSFSHGFQQNMATSGIQAPQTAFPQYSFLPSPYPMPLMNFGFLYPPSIPLAANSVQPQMSSCPLPLHPVTMVKEEDIQTSGPLHHSQNGLMAMNIVNSSLDRNHQNGKKQNGHGVQMVMVNMKVGQQKFANV